MAYHRCEDVRDNINSVPTTSWLLIFTNGKRYSLKLVFCRGCERTLDEVNVVINKSRSCVDFLSHALSHPVHCTVESSECVWLVGGGGEIDRERENSFVLHFSGVKKLFLNSFPKIIAQQIRKAIEM